MYLSYLPTSLNLGRDENGQRLENGENLQLPGATLCSSKRCLGPKLPKFSARVNCRVLPNLRTYAKVRYGVSRAASDHRILL